MCFISDEKEIPMHWKISVALGKDYIAFATAKFITPRKSGRRFPTYAWDILVTDILSRGHDNSASK